jgi:hypothetical protein
MTMITDNTGIKSTATVAGIDWTKTAYPSYYQLRSDDGRFVITQSFSRGFFLYVVNADGEFDAKSLIPGFATAKDAQFYAATLVEVAA